MSVDLFVSQPTSAPVAPVASVAPVVSDDREVRAGTVVGVDTHQLTHHAAVIDTHHRRLGDREFPATSTGYRELLEWAASFGIIGAFGIESTGSYGAGLTRYLLTSDVPTGQPGGSGGVEVFEVNRPERSTRARQGKSDPIDAYAAAEQVLTGRANARPKITTGIVEAIRTLKVPRDAAVRDRTRALNQLRDLITTAPATIREDLIGLPARARVTKTAAFRPDATRLHEPHHAAKQALRALARRIQHLEEEISTADRALAALTAQAAPTLLAMPQIGPQIAAQLLITAGQNPDRLTSEAAFARLTGTAPLPASSGKTNRHRLNRGGDRDANSVIHIAVIGRMRHHPETRAYVERRRTEGLTNPEIIRCLKRHLCRSLYKALTTDLLTP